MTDLTPRVQALRYTPKHPIGLGYLLGCATFVAAVGALYVLPDKAMDQLLRLLERRG